MLNSESLLFLVISCSWKWSLFKKKVKLLFIKGKAYVNEVLVAEADFMAGIVDKPKEINSAEAK